MKTIPHINYDQLLPQIPFINATKGNNNDNPTNATREDLDELLVEAINSNKECLDKDIYGIAPAAHSYFLIIHPNLVWWFMNLQHFIHSDSYPRKDAVLKNELGNVGNLRVIVDKDLPIHEQSSAEDRSVYNCLLFGGALDKKEDFINFRVTIP